MIAEQVFNCIDTNNDGLISKSEACANWDCKDAKKRGKTQTEINAAIKKMDADSDGKINLKEFDALVNG